MVCLVGVTGIARAGKDTLADCLASTKYDVKVPLAGPLKLGVATMLDVPLVWTNSDDIKDKELPEFGFSLRKAMQTLGTEWGRALSEDLWVNIAHKKYRQHVEQMRVLEVTDSLFVVPDVRFDNEASWIREQGGEVIRVVRDVEKRVEAHAREAGVSEDVRSITVHNNNTKEEFMYRAKELRKELIAQEQQWTETAARILNDM
jgi:hypothetical protein